MEENLPVVVSWYLFLKRNPLRNSSSRKKLNSILCGYGNDIGGMDFILFRRPVVKTATLQRLKCRRQ
jgi:hypothetical protein